MAFWLVILLFWVITFLYLRRGGSFKNLMIFAISLFLVSMVVGGFSIHMGKVGVKWEGLLHRK